MHVVRKNVERYETELGDRETVLTGSVFALPTVGFRCSVTVVDRDDRVLQNIRKASDVQSRK
jgi:hypothetical protein